MNVVFDMDLTLVDETGLGLRPGTRELLGSLRRNGVELTLWTHSTRTRTHAILRLHEIFHYFDRIITREDYALNSEALPKKDIRDCGGDILVDDLLHLVNFVEQVGCRGFLITQHLSDLEPDSEELERLHQMILPEVEFSL